MHPAFKVFRCNSSSAASLIVNDALKCSGSFKPLNLRLMLLKFISYRQRLRVGTLEQERNWRHKKNFQTFQLRNLILKNNQFA